MNFFNWIQSQLERHDEVGNFAEIMVSSFGLIRASKKLENTDEFEMWEKYLVILELPNEWNQILSMAWEEYQQEQNGEIISWKDHEGRILVPFCRVMSLRYLERKNGSNIRGYLIKNPLNGKLFVYWRGGWCSQILCHRRDLQIIEVDPDNTEYYLYLEKVLLNNLQGTRVDIAGRVIQGLNVVDEVSIGGMKGGCVISVPGDQIFIVWNMKCVKSYDEYQDGELRVVGTVQNKTDILKLLQIGKLIRNRIVNESI